MKNVLKLEELGLLLLFSFVYFLYFGGTWALFLSLFLVPDVAFFLYIVNKKAGTMAYNFMHHRGVMVLLAFIGYYSHHKILIFISLIFLAHISFDRVAGYGLKYLDDFDKTHLGWIGKSKHKNI